MLLTVKGSASAKEAQQHQHFCNKTYTVQLHILDARNK
jgi:hypothetical protein